MSTYSTKMDPPCMRFLKCLRRGAWVAQSVKQPTSTQVMISRFVNSSPVSSSVLTVRSLLVIFSLYLCLCLCLSLPLPCSCSFSQNKYINFVLCLFIFEREREREWGRSRERGRHRIPKQASGSELSVQGLTQSSNSRTVRS